MTWQLHAACLGAPPAWWVPSSERDAAYAKARPICDRCPVQDDCLLDAIEHEQDLADDYQRGMRGGLTPAERRELARTLGKS